MHQKPTNHHEHHHNKEPREVATETGATKPAQEQMKPLLSEVRVSRQSFVALLLAVALLSSLVTARAFGHYPLNVDNKSFVVARPGQGMSVSIPWAEMGAALVREGVIDESKWQELYQARGGLTTDEQALLTANAPAEVIMDAKNASYFLNLLWAVGLGNAHEALAEGSMQDERYGGAGNFASTGGWTLARGDTMQHYGAHRMIPLTPEEAERVTRVSQDIYRPCCNNATHFPDCNHGMAMLGLMELMASKGATDEELYQAALSANSLWFREQYQTITAFVESRGLQVSQIPAKELVGQNFASASAFQAINKEINQGGGGGASCAA
ncbi:MAG: hypothetical protein COV10_04460 [Candidatus Vogelbacteria bacterium CG10_big_fil_rev_8_21_14_0_10_51_16]|uniref:Uncharacterized protein n=1 Tax=Candidatus Vogelbacteria bacterium CG10_big_fil_rev_8_21_14_0_10_51_16 TaxID=1975045 RepID=A0A2H0RD88_9BACT|nr:MAG: hypothetical protein COV10_04460 [Candidatus Vogelbacteria bacterium CG10_big_fil_rev_8_21_14_0_10_51_16]